MSDRMKSDVKPFNGDFRIVMIGDSFTSGNKKYSVSGRSFTPYEMQNYGKSGVEISKDVQVTDFDMADLIGQDLVDIIETTTPSGT